MQHTRIYLKITHKTQVAPIKQLKFQSLTSTRQVFRPSFRLSVKSRNARALPQLIRAVGGPFSRSPASSANLSAGAHDDGRAERNSRPAAERRMNNRSSRLAPGQFSRAARRNDIPGPAFRGRLSPSLLLSRYN